MKGFCFVAGTEIATPEGGKVIETFVNGDTVITLGAVNDVIALHDMGEKETHQLHTIDCQVETTATEKVLTPHGLKLVEALEIGEPIMTVHGYQVVTVCEPTGETKHVYELQCTGDNLFYANGIMAEGISEEELKLIAEAPEETPEETPEEKPEKKTTKKSKKADKVAEEATEEVEKVEE